MCYLTLSLKSATVQFMAIQEMRRNPDWPVGLAHNAMAPLEKKFKLTICQNPEEIGESISAVEVKYNK